MKRRPGRPALGEAARSRVVSVPLSPLEHASIALAVAQERANGHPATVVSWIRDHALEPLKR